MHTFPDALAGRGSRQTMTQFHRFQRGDVVEHPRRPEWGQGTVKDVAPISHDGQQAQRLSVDFANKGRVVINTAIAPLTPKTQDASMTRMTTGTERDGRTTFGNGASGAPASGGGGSGGNGWLSQLERANGHTKHELWELPKGVTDPFATLAQRLDATLDTYRYSTDPRSLIDWAVAQTGLGDPLSKYTRHELEQAFPRFARDRDQHLVSLVKQIKRKGETLVLLQAGQKTKYASAKNALQKAMRG